MVARIQRLGFQTATRLIFAQLILTGIMSVTWWMASNGKAAYSTMLGGLVATIPNGLFAYRLFGNERQRSARTIISSLYRGEALKLVTTMVLFTLVFRFISVTALPFFITYCLTLMVFWVFLKK
jgi:ATP synthase protein I